MSARPHTALPLDRPAATGRRHARMPTSWSGAGVVPGSALGGADALVVLEGVVAVSMVLPSGRTIGVALLGPAEIWSAREGEGGLESFRIEALCPSRLRGMALDTLLQVASAPEVATALIRALLRRAGNAERRYAALTTLPVEERVLSLLYHLAALRGVPCPRGVRIQLDLSQDRVASLTGTTRESVNRALRTLQRRGVVRRDGLRYEVAGGGS